jgi:hypothetical protein
LRHPAELPRCSIGVYRCKFLSNLTSVAAGKTTLTSFGSGSSIVSLACLSPPWGGYFVMFQYVKELSPFMLRKVRYSKPLLISPFTIHADLHHRFRLFPSFSKPANLAAGWALTKCLNSF